MATFGLIRRYKIRKNIEATVDMPTFVGYSARGENARIEKMGNKPTRSSGERHFEMMGAEKRIAQGSTNPDLGGRA